MCKINCSGGCPDGAPEDHLPLTPEQAAAENAQLAAIRAIDAQWAVEHLQTPITCTGVREYGDEMPVTINRLTPADAKYYRAGQELVVRAINEGGHNATEVDLLQLLRFVRDNLPAAWNHIQQQDPEPKLLEL